MSFVAPMATAAAKMGPILSLAGSGVQALAQRQQGKAAANVQEYNARVAAENAALIERAAAQQKEVGKKRKERYLSTMKAQFAFRGVELTGSPLLAMAESAAALELDIQTEEFNALVDANRARSQAAVFGMEAGYYRKAGNTSAAGTLLGGASKFLSEY